ncbi:MAG: aldo/keto reductase [Planctomycetota bacterium]
MLYRDFGKTGWKVSAIGLGTWNIGNQWGYVDDTTAWATVHKALDCGINLIDTAEEYGLPHGFSEERLGIALAGIRHRVYLVSKIGYWGERSGQMVPKTTVDMIRLCCHACLGRLRTDWIDVMLCHEGDIENPSIYLEAFDLLKKEGKIRAYGISTDDINVLRNFNIDGNCSVAQFGYSLLSPGAEIELLPYCQKNGIAVEIKGPLAKGLLSGYYDHETVFTDEIRKSWNRDGVGRGIYETAIARVQQLKKILKPGEQMVTAALRYIISHPANPVAIPGAKSPEQVMTNAAAGERVLTSREMDNLKAVI